MQFIFNMIKGAIIGIANVIPGVSGGTMAVSLGIYEKLIHALTTLRKEWKKNLIFLVAIVLGAAIGIVGFAKVIEILLNKQPLPTALAFVGLVLGGLPLIIKSLNQSLENEKSRFGVSHVIVFIAFCALVLVMALLDTGNGIGAEKEIGAVEMLLLFFVGMFAAAAMVIPGVSGSMLMMVLGYYDTIISTINRFIEALIAFDISAMLACFKVLIPFGFGVLAGIFAIAKLIDFLFKRFASQTFSAILGLVAASPGAIILNIKNEYGLHVSAAGILVSAALFALCFAVTCWFGRKAS